MKILRAKQNVGFVIITLLMVMLKQEIIVTSVENRGAAHRDVNVKVNLNHKSLIIFHKLKNCDSHVVMQELIRIFRF